MHYVIWAQMQLYWLLAHVIPMPILVMEFGEQTKTMTAHIGWFWKTAVWYRKHAVLVNRKNDIYCLLRGCFAVASIAVSDGMMVLHFPSSGEVVYES